MVTHERRFRDHDPEKIPALVREAIKRAPVDEYLRLRYFTRGCSNDEHGQIIWGAAEIGKQAEKMQKKYSLDDPIQFSADPLVIGARLILTRVPLSTYLAARHEVLEAAIASLIRQRDEYELLGAREVEKENEKLGGRLADLNLTNKVSAAAKTFLQ